MTKYTEQGLPLADVAPREGDNLNVCFSTPSHLRTMALAVHDGARAALTEERYITAISYLQFEATLWRLLDKPVLANAAAQRANDAYAAILSKHVSDTVQDLEDDA